MPCADGRTASSYALGMALYTSEFGYMSDPDVVFDGSLRYLPWADGDNTTCGGFKVAPINSNWRTIDGRTVSTIVINGVEVLGSCDPDGSAGPIGRPYMEGASIYKTGSTWTLYFAVKPTSTPTECATGVGGPGSANEAIAWATASAPTGPYSYKGIIMCGSSTEWTNQATVQTLPNGRKIMVYHDAGTGADYRQRNLHAECMFTNGTIVAGIYRQAQNATNGFDHCMAGTNADYWALYAKDPDQLSKPPILRAPSDGSALKADRYAVGPYERFKIESLGNGVYAIKALSTGKYLCTPDDSTAVTASCTSASDTSGSTWGRTSVTGGGHRFQSRKNSKYLSVAGNGQLYASATGTSTAVIITYLYAGGKFN